MEAHERFTIVLDLLIKKGLIKSYKHFGDIIDSPRQGVYDIKSGKKNLSLDTLVCMKKSFECINVNFLLFEEGPPLLEDKPSETGGSKQKRLGSQAPSLHSGGTGKEIEDVQILEEGQTPYDYTALKEELEEKNKIIRYLEGLLMRFKAGKSSEK